ncbi:undecaprenyl diphosphate synthase family protein, partial [Staphylococcus aureus]
ENLLAQINKAQLPAHIAIIMDGNGRWAEEKGQERLYGHFHGVESVRNIVEGAAELGIGYLTLYAFSTENWDRPRQEVDGLMA